MTPNEILAHDRRLAAVHEAGHVVVARSCGGKILSCWIVPNDEWTVELALNEKSWIGRTQTVHLDHTQRRLVGVAGIVAGRRNRNFKILRDHGDSLFVKQVPLVHPETVSSFLKEAACAQLAADAAERSALRAVMPQLKRYDPDAHVLAYGLLDSAETLSEVAARGGAIPLPLIGQLARTLASCHLETAGSAALSRVASVLSGQPPWVLIIGQNAEMVMPNMNQGRRQVVDTIRATPELYNGLLDLRTRWRRLCLMHGDMKWDNVLLVTLPDGKQELRLIDWELADLGDPLWDVASLLGSFLQHWLLNLPLQHMHGDLQQAVARAPLQIAAVHGPARELWASYLMATRGELAVGTEFFADTVRLVGARLVLLAFELLPNEAAITPHAVFALHIARYLLAQPVQAASDLLGVSAQFLRGAGSEFDSNVAPNRPWQSAGQGAHTG
jgi:Phosphotransferase enzyme family